MYRNIYSEMEVGQVAGRVDWLTWTMKQNRRAENIQESYSIVRRAVKGLSDEHEQVVYSGAGFDRSPRFSNFDLCLSRDDKGCRTGVNGPRDYCIVDLTGRGCDPISEPDVGRRFVSQIIELLSRFDYAVDIPCDTRPGNFANSRSHNGFRSVSFVRSDKGETAYVGSRKSDRFARVYRYNPPHPRSHLLRMEYVFRRGMARAAAEQYCASESDTHYAQRLEATWGFTHKVLGERGESIERITAPSVSKHDEDTVAWLYKQVVPAMRRVIAAGALDVADFLERVYNQQE